MFLNIGYSKYMFLDFGFLVSDYSVERLHP